MRLEGHIEIGICRDTKIKIELGNVGELLEIGNLGEPWGPPRGVARSGGRSSTFINLSPFWNYT